MDQEVIKQEIQTLFERMGFLQDIESIEVHQGVTNRFSVRVNPALAYKGGVKGNYSLQEVGNTEDDLHATGDYSRGGGRVSHMLIGEYGVNLIATEHILKKIIKKKYGEDQKFTLDINDYRMRRLEDLKQDVKTAAKAVRMYHKEVPLRSMSSFERRIVHMLLEEYPDITTQSVGEEPDRRVIIKPYP